MQKLIRSVSKRNARLFSEYHNKVLNDIKLDFKDVLIRPRKASINIESRSQVNMMRTFKFKWAKNEWTGCPIVSANMDTTGTLEILKEFNKQKLLVALHKFYEAKDLEQFLSKNEDCKDQMVVSSGTSDKDIIKLGEILKATGTDKICLDVANGYTQKFVDTVKKIRELHPDKVIIAGNVVTADISQELVSAGADIIKLGIGPGSVCTTRKQTGVGFPQLSTIMECSEAVHYMGGHVMGDGGITCPGDASKAFGGGADFIMIGGMFAGHDESGGETVELDGKKYKAFYGMSSSEAMDKYHGGVAKYRSSEGKEVIIPSRGPIEATVLDLLGGIRSTCTYVGAHNVESLFSKTVFLRVNQQLNDVFNSNEMSEELNAKVRAE